MGADRSVGTNPARSASRFLSRTASRFLNKIVKLSLFLTPTTPPNMSVTRFLNKIVSRFHGRNALPFLANSVVLSTDKIARLSTEALLNMLLSKSAIMFRDNRPSTDLNKNAPLLMKGTVGRFQGRIATMCKGMFINFNKDFKY